MTQYTTYMRITINSELSLHLILQKQAAALCRFFTGFCAPAARFQFTDRFYTILYEGSLEFAIPICISCKNCGNR